eukprot:gnl/MRDRNA2_/MRDRNA2_108669_c0_seq1.p1 gnl/MRDRNA2_/MRDRNA2_108669_c0~~gnl/MRDRNA2_/MRDRNA2_108669_c0_seq1.p1  ORF type:complete len:502 (-),score=76.32 gnl/MRDRNA2_/MRDRNA2_108669_c0_seq1:155-1660(-)
MATAPKAVPEIKVAGEGNDDGEKKAFLAWPDNGAVEIKESPRCGGVFTDLDPEYIKKQVRAALLTAEPYNVFNFYKTEGPWQWLAKHPVFENTTLAVISLNAVYIAIDTDWNKDVPFTPTETKSLTESGVFFQFMEHSFCLYFTAEWITRFMAFERKLNGLKDGWFIFDSALVFMMVMETWVLLIVMAASGTSGGSPLGGNTSILRLFRLLRLSRLMRMLRSLPELLILVKGMVTAMKSVVYVMGLLVILTYVFAIAFTQLAVGTETIGEVHFANVAHSMYSLIVYATLLDNMADFLDAVRFEHWPLLALSFIYIALAALTVMNMLTGVLCEVVSAVADTEREIILTETVKEKMLAIVDSLDTNENNHISYEEFTKIMAMPEALQALEDVDVNPVGIVDFAEFFFFEDGTAVELTFEDFMECILDLRASNAATVKDVLDLWKKIKTTTSKEGAVVRSKVDSLSVKIEGQLGGVKERTEKLEGQIAELGKEIAKVVGKYCPA